jgi:hypothetical protein
MSYYRNLDNAILYEATYTTLISQPNTVEIKQINTVHSS